MIVDDAFFEEYINKTKYLLTHYRFQVLFQKDTLETSENLFALMEEFLQCMKTFIKDLYLKGKYEQVIPIKKSKKLEEWKNLFNRDYLDEKTRATCLDYLEKVQIDCDVCIDSGLCDDEVARINEAVLPKPFYAAASGPPVLNTLPPIRKNNQAALEVMDKIITGNEDLDNKEGAVGHPSSPKRMEKR